ITELMWNYTLLKILDMFDTIFFILRKQEERVSQFQVIHHILMLLFSWIFAKFTP
ncbi:hypothetical protein L9F63_010599, partial [Diploptera punctata]